MLLSTLLFASAMALDSLKCDPGHVEIDHWCAELDPATGKCPLVDRDINGVIHKVAKSYPHGRTCSWPCGIPAQVSLNDMFQDELKAQMANGLTGHQAVHEGRVKTWAECRRLCDVDQQCTTYTMDYKFFGCFLSTNEKPCGEYKYSCHFKPQNATWFETGPNCGMNAALSKYTVKNCRDEDLSQACPAARPPTATPTPGPTTLPVPEFDECLTVAPGSCPQMTLKVLNRLSPAEAALEANFQGTFEDCVAHVRSMEHQGAGYAKFGEGKCESWVIRNCVNGAVAPDVCPQTKQVTPAPTVAVPEFDECLTVGSNPGSCPQFTLKALNRLSPAEAALEADFQGTFEDCVAHVRSLEHQGAGYAKFGEGKCESWVIRNCINGAVPPAICPQTKQVTAEPTNAPTEAAKAPVRAECMTVANACPQMRVSALGRLTPEEIAFEENFFGNFDECVAYGRSMFGKGAGYVEFVEGTTTDGGKCITQVVRGCVNGQVPPAMCPAAKEQCDAGIHMNHNGQALNINAGTTTSDLITDSACECELACEKRDGCGAWTFLPDGIMWPKNTCVLRKRCFNEICGFNPNFIEPNQRSGELEQCEAGIHMNHNGQALNINAGTTTSDLITDSACECELACVERDGCGAWTFLPDGIMWPKNTCVLRKRCFGEICGFNPNFIEPNQRSGELEIEQCEAGIHMNHNGQALNTNGATTDLVTDSACLCEDACEQRNGCEAWTWLPDGLFWPKNSCILRKRCNGTACGFNPNFIEPKQRSGELETAPKRKNDDLQILKLMAEEARRLKDAPIPKNPKAQQRMVNRIKLIRRALKALLRRIDH